MTKKRALALFSPMRSVAGDGQRFMFDRHTLVLFSTPSLRFLLRLPVYRDAALNDYFRLRAERGAALFGAEPPSNSTGAG